MKCKHIYENLGLSRCDSCGETTHEVDWKEQNRLQKEWLKKNPDAWRNVGWWSI